MTKLFAACICLLLPQLLMAAQEETVGGIGGTGSQEEITGGIGGTGIRDMERPEILERPELLESREALEDLIDMDASEAADFDTPSSGDLPDAEMP